jgi:hypothetical protein
MFIRLQVENAEAAHSTMLRSGLRNLLVRPVCVQMNITSLILYTWNKMAFWGFFISGKDR